jgi:hypothetical protein
MERRLRSLLSPASRAPRTLLAILLCAGAERVPAAIFTVGAAGGGCTHTTIQAAVNAAAANSEADTVRITRTQSYLAQQVVVNTTQDLNIVGGFATCASTVSDGTRTIVSGAGGDTLPVFDLRAPTDASIKFRLLRITGGDQDGDGTGGGINYVGVGLVELIETLIDNNVAAYGGGIYFNGTSEHAELRISNDVLVSSNEATVSGGGVYLYGGSMTMTAPRSSLAFNRATQFGGGLQVLASAAGTEARIGSGGVPGLATIEGNEAAQGGGISVSAPDVGDTEARLDLQTVDPTAPTRIVRNVASAYGGAIHLQNHLEDLEFGFVSAALVNTELDGNRAPDAAAVLLGTGGADDEIPLGASLTMSGGRMTGHAASTVVGAATDGALIVARAGANVLLQRVRIDGNESGPLMHASNANRVGVEDSLIHANIIRGPLFEILEQSDGFHVVGSTIVDNAMTDGGRPNAPVIFADEGVILRRMLIWQPGRVTLDSGTADTDDVLASEIDGLSPGGTYATDAPRFLDPDAGDYRLQAASPAVDFSALVDGSDLNGVARNIDVDRVADLDGRGDLGAFERQTLGNLVLNPGFATDLRLWSLVSGASATRELSGENSAGAVTLSRQGAPGGEFTGFVQCVRVPGPGAWRLSGFAFGGGGDPFTRDIPSIRWRLIFDTGDESCGGALGAEGNIGFANAAAYTQGETVIDVPDAQWTPYTAIEVQLRVREGSLNINATTTGHFDGIVLEATDAIASGLPFADGFEG